MNNMFHAFRISVPGSVLDDKFFFDYMDYRSVEQSQTIDYDKSLVKAIANVRMYRLKQSLSTLQAPIYLDVKFSTDGTALTVPSGLQMVVGFGSLENLSSVGIVDDASLQNAKDAAVQAIKAVISDVLSTDHTMYSWVVDKYTKANNPISNVEVTHVALREEYVTATAITSEFDVQYIELQVQNTPA